MTGSILDAGYAPAGDARARYETEGVTLVRYLARRTAKTRLLIVLPDLLPAAGQADARRALAAFGIFCAAAATSFGRGYRQPSFDAVGAEVEEVDPETGARIVARLDGRDGSSRFRLSVRATLPGIATFEGSEEITGTTVSIRGLGMPAPSRFSLVSLPPLAPWSATAIGVITTELAPRLTGALVRGHGSLRLADDRGTRGDVALDRSGLATARIEGADPLEVRRSFRR